MSSHELIGDVSGKHKPRDKTLLMKKCFFWSLTHWRRKKTVQLPKSLFSRLPFPVLQAVPQEDFLPHLFSSMSSCSRHALPCTASSRSRPTRSCAPGRQSVLARAQHHALQPRRKWPTPTLPETLPCHCHQPRSALLWHRMLCRIGSHDVTSSPSAPLFHTSSWEREATTTRMASSWWELCAKTSKKLSGLDRMRG